MTQTDGSPPVALNAMDVAPRTKASNYPELFFSRMLGRKQQQLCRKGIVCEVLQPER